MTGAGSSSLPTCPVCDARCADPPLRRFTVAQAAAHFCPPSRSAERYRRLEQCIRRLWGGETCSIHVCRECTFGFGWPYVGGDGEFYAALHEMAGYPADRWEFRYTIDELIRPAQPGSVLDIGAGTGAFLRGVPSSWRRVGVETTEGVRSALSAGGVLAVASPEEAAAHVSGGFSVVTLFQVLEHVAEFPQLFAQIRSLLAPDGRLVVSVPHGERLPLQEELTGCADMPPNHINRWTPESLRRAFARHGFTMLKHAVEPPSVRHLAYRASLKVRATASRDPSSWAAWSFGIPRRSLRLPVQIALSLCALLTMLRHFAEMRAGHSILAISRPT